MSILIKGMKMPKSCIACHLNFGEKRPEYGLTICCPYSDGVISWRYKAFDNGRLDSCGIVPVPPHGRCIDADALAKRIKDEGRNQAEYYADRYAPVVMAYGDCYGKVESAPTIIPAEEGKT